MEKLFELSHQNPALFVDILESIKDAIFISDHEGTTLWLNSASEAMCGVPKNKITGRNVRDLEKEGLFKPSVLRMALEEGKNVSTVQTVGEGRKYIATGHLVKNKEGKVIAAVAHLRDITDAVKNTSKLQEIEELLEKYSAQIRKLTSTKTNINGVENVKLGGKSNSRILAKKIIEKIAAVDTTALIVGETGTGKSLAAEKIHLLSKRRNGPFVQINCASLPESLLESELFGYEKGSFTGATSKGKTGLIKAAEAGTLFLDEIGEVPLHLQTKILHFLQSKTYMPIGAREPRNADVRIIAATNRDLEQMVEEGTFRSDLFYRLNILTVKIPSLRESRDDIEDLATYFLNMFNEKYNKNKRFSNEVLKKLIQYSWPGNIRELENLIERLVILSEDEFIEEKDLPQKMVEQHMSSNSPYISDRGTMTEILEEMEKKMIIDALEKENSTRKAAKFLGVSQSLLMRRIKKYNIQLVVEESKTFVK
ncbi:PAS domain S-box protein [Siminovitchia acidinfaciens]|uniref:HTH-type transcriptional regulatory protein TyrR n=1 Tax=Siminovitchia acidinfaciens TaxID=2321395 RepID=A0A429XUX3_9BACI|nr:sigma 54-interacting transcriptional regulator [Siminovitchia acidinfaciens]RST71991.1 PAS domain S-box protein [Siminovitchia acidinfaciens]